MAGEVKKIIEQIIQFRSKGNATIARLTETKLILSGINPEDFSDSSEDDKKTIDRVKEIGRQMGLSI